MGGVWFPMGAGNLIFLCVLTSNCVSLHSRPLDAGNLFRGSVKWLEAWSYYSSPFIGEVQNARIFTSTPKRVFMARRLNRHGLYNVFEKYQQMHSDSLVQLLLQSNHRHVSVYSRDLFQGDEIKYKNKIIMCRNRSTVKNRKIFWLKFTV